MNQLKKKNKKNMTKGTNSLFNGFFFSATKKGQYTSLANGKYATEHGANLFKLLTEKNECKI